MSNGTGVEDRALAIPGDLIRQVGYLESVFRGIEDEGTREKCVALLADVIDDTLRVRENMECVALEAVRQRNEALREAEGLRELAEFGEAVQALDLSNAGVRRFLIKLKNELRAAGAANANK